MKAFVLLLFFISASSFAGTYPFDGSLKQVDLAREVRIFKSEVAIDDKIFSINGSRPLDTYTAINSGTGKRICKSLIGFSKKVASNKIVVLEAAFSSSCGIFGGTRGTIPFMYTYHLITLRSDGRPLKVESLQALSSMMLPQLTTQELLVDQIWETNLEFKKYLKSSWGESKVRSSVRFL